MRPVRRGVSPRQEDFANYRDAYVILAARLGTYCSYCERRVQTMLAIEHIQPKELHPNLEGCWENFLLACVNCNSIKRMTDVDLATVILPDRDNTFVAFTYFEDGTVNVRERLPPDAEAQAQATLTLVGLNRPFRHAEDANDRLVAIDRVSQRMEVWGKALEARTHLNDTPHNESIRRLIVDLAVASGFFSIWMAAFADDADLRNRLIDAFGGTRASGCFDPATTAPVQPAPNPDALDHGSKT